MITEIQATKERLKKDLNRKDFELLKVLKQSAAEIEETEPQLIGTVLEETNSGTVA